MAQHARQMKHSLQRCPHVASRHVKARHALLIVRHVCTQHHRHDVSHRCPDSPLAHTAARPAACSIPAHTRSGPSRLQGARSTVASTVAPAVAPCTSLPRPSSVNSEVVDRLAAPVRVGRCLLITVHRGVVGRERMRSVGPRMPSPLGAACTTWRAGMEGSQEPSRLVSQTGPHQTRFRHAPHNNTLSRVGVQHITRYTSLGAQTTHRSACGWRALSAKQLGPLAHAPGIISRRPSMMQPFDGPERCESAGLGLSNSARCAGVAMVRGVGVVDPVRGGAMVPCSAHTPSTHNQPTALHGTASSTRSVHAEFVAPTT